MPTSSKFAIVLATLVFAAGVYAVFQTYGGTSVNVTLFGGEQGGPIDLERGLVAHYTFDGTDVDWASTTAEVRDRSGNSFSADATTTMGSLTSTLPGVIGQGLFFDGITHTITTTPLSLETISASAVTLSFWAKDVNPSLTSGTIVTGGQNGGGTVDYFRVTIYQAGVCNAGATLFVQFQGQAGANNKCYVLPDDTEWHHYVVVLDKSKSAAGEILLYMDGSFTTSPDEGTTHNNPDDGYNNAPVYVMSDGSGTDYSSGSLDELRVYSRVLSAGEVKRLYELGATAKVNTTLQGGESGGPIDLTRGLVRHYTFDGPSMDWASATAEVVDQSPQGTRADAGGMSASTSAAQGVLGQALSFDGANDRVVSGNVDLSASGAVSVALWLKTDTIANEEIAFHYEDDADSLLFFVVVPRTSTGLCNSGELLIKMRGGALYGNNHECHVVSELDNWHHYVFLFDKSQPAEGEIPGLYIDGIPHALNSDGDHQNSEGTFGIGTLKLMHNNGDELPGTLDDFRLYNRTLSAEEIRHLYELGATAKVNTTLQGGESGGAIDLTRGLVGHAPFDGSPGTYTNIAPGNFTALTPYTPSVVPTYGVMGQALSLNGTDQGVYLSVSATNSVRTISMWAKFNTTTANEPLVSIAGTQYLETNGAGEVAVSGMPGATLYVDGSSASVAIPEVGEWHHIAALIPGGTATNTSFTGVNATLFTTETPSTLEESDTNSVTLGVRWYTDSPGAVTGVRFYKGGTSGGSTHTGALYTSTGTLLASKVSSGETSSGWQTITFDSPVVVAANTEYVAAVFWPSGWYPATPNFFTSPFDRAPLHAYGTTNGVYDYAGSLSFPMSVFSSTNYFTDVIITDSNAVDWRVGHATSTAAFLDGSVDDIRLYDRLLAPEEIRRLYELGQ